MPNPPPAGAGGPPSTPKATATAAGTTPGAVPSLAGEHKIIRRKINDPNFKKKYTLPKAVTNWRIVNEGTTDIKWATNDRPPDEGEDAWSLLPGRSADSPPISPAHEGHPVELWIANVNAGESVTITIIYTTSNDPRVIAQFSNVSLGLDTSDIEIGAVELKDGSGDQRVTITSGPDGIKYIETDVSGSAVTTSISGNVVQVSGQIIAVSGQVVVIGAANGGRTAAIVPPTTTTTVTQALGATSGAVATVSQMVAMGTNFDGATYTDFGLFPVEQQQIEGRWGTNTISTFPGGLTSGRKGLLIQGPVGGWGLNNQIPVPFAVGTSGALVIGGAQLGGTSATPILVDSSGRIITSVSGNIVQVSGQAVTISGNIVQVSGQAVTVSGNIIQVSGQVVQVSGEAVTMAVQLGTTTSKAGQTNTSGVIYVGSIADSTLGLIYSGVVSWVSGASANTVKQAGFAVPLIRHQDDVYLVSIFHGGLSSDITVRVNNFRVFNGTNRRAEVSRFTALRNTSGTEAVVQGLFAGNTSGELILLNDQATIEVISAEVQVYVV